MKYLTEESVYEIMSFNEGEKLNKIKYKYIDEIMIIDTLSFYEDTEIKGKVLSVSQTQRYSNVNGDKYNLMSGNAFESIGNINPEIINSARLSYLSNCENIVKSFNLFFNGLFNKLVGYNINLGNNYTSTDIVPLYKELNMAVTAMFSGIKALMAKENISYEQAVKFVKEDFIPQSLTEGGCRELVNIRINNTKLYNNYLRIILQQNNDLFNLSRKEADLYLDKLNSSTGSQEVQAKIKEILDNPEVLNKFLVKNYVYDFRKIGAGCLFLSNEDNDIHSAFHPKKHLQLLFRYDAIIVSHGQTAIDRKTGKHLWYMHSTNSLTKDGFENIVKYLRQLKAEGFKNVLVMCCNPEGIKLPEDIKKDKNFKVSYSLHSNLMESTIQELDSINEQCDLLLNEVNNNDSGKLKKAISIITMIWNKIKEVLNNIWSFIKGIKVDNSSKLKKPIEVSFVVIDNGNAKVVTRKIDNIGDIQKSYSDNCARINNFINTASDKETTQITKLVNNIEQGQFKQSITSNNEAFALNEVNITVLWLKLKEAFKALISSIRKKRTEAKANNVVNKTVHSNINLSSITINLNTSVYSLNNTNFNGLQNIFFTIKNELNNINPSVVINSREEAVSKIVENNNKLGKISKLSNLYNNIGISYKLEDIKYIFNKTNLTFNTAQDLSTYITKQMEIIDKIYNIINDCYVKSLNQMESINVDSVTNDFVIMYFNSLSVGINNMIFNLYNHTCKVINLVENSINLLCEEFDKYVKTESFCNIVVID